MKILIEESVLRQALAELERVSNTWCTSSENEITALRTALDSAETVESIEAENKRLSDCLTYEQHLAERIGTHGSDCHTWGPQHYECAMREIVKLHALIEQQHDALLGESRVQNRWSDAMIEALAAYEEFNK